MWPVVFFLAQADPSTRPALEALLSWMLQEGHWCAVEEELDDLYDEVSDGMDDFYDEGDRGG